MKDMHGDVYPKSQIHPNITLSGFLSILGVDPLHIEWITGTWRSHWFKNPFETSLLCYTAEYEAYLSTTFQIRPHRNQGYIYTCTSLDYLGIGR